MSFEHCELDPNGRPVLVAKSSDGRHFELVCSFDYVSRDGTRYRAPIGAKSDGASTPPELWCLLGQQWLAPFGSYWPAVFIHDGAYQNWLQRVANDGTVSLANLDRQQSDDLCNELMEFLGVSLGERCAIYEGIHEFGWRAFREDRAAVAATS